MCFTAGIKKGSSGTKKQILRVCWALEKAGKKFSTAQRFDRAGPVIKGLTNYTIMSINKGISKTKEGRYPHYPVDVTSYVVQWENLVEEDMDSYQKSYTDP